MQIHQRIKFRHLQCFLEVARQSSVGKAAISLAITQPAVSKTIRELEDILEVKLVIEAWPGLAESTKAQIVALVSKSPK